MPNWERLYREEVSSHLLTKGALNAERQLREQDRQYANREYRKLMTQYREQGIKLDATLALYTELLNKMSGLLDKMQSTPRQPRKTTVVDLSAMSDEQIRQYIIDNPGMIQVKG